METYSILQTISNEATYIENKTQLFFLIVSSELLGKAYPETLLIRINYSKMIR